MPLTRDDIIFTREVPKHLVLDPTRFDVALADIYGIGNFNYETKGDDIVVTVNVPAPFDLKKAVQDRGGAIFEAEKTLPFDPYIKKDEDKDKNTGKKPETKK